MKDRPLVDIDVEAAIKRADRLLAELKNIDRFKHLGRDDINPDDK